MNPPFHDPLRQNISPDPPRRAAHAAPPGRAFRMGRYRGAAASLGRYADADLARRRPGRSSCRARTALRRRRAAAGPCRAGQPAIRILVRASKGSRTPLSLLPGLLLNDEDGRPTAEAEAVLRGGAGAAADQRLGRAIAEQWGPVFGKDHAQTKGSAAARRFRRSGTPAGSTSSAKQEQDFHAGCRSICRR